MTVPTKFRLLAAFIAIACVTLLLQQARAQVAVHSSVSSGATSLNPINRTLSILKDVNVQNDLEIVQDQMDQMKAVRTEMFDELNRMAMEFRADNAHLTGEDLERARVEFRELIKTQTAVYELKSKKILLPHQQKRLDQLVVRRAFQQLGPSRVLLESVGNSNFTNLLGLTDEQKANLETVSEEANKKLAQKVEKAKTEAIQEILSVLSATQRKKLDELMGNPLTKKKSDEATKKAPIRFRH
ncbi:MAG: hypothetical protein AB8B55_12185 [Mariniblastus sp.]